VTPKEKLDALLDIIEILDWDLGSSCSDTIELGYLDKARNAAKKLLDEFNKEIKS